MDKDKFLKGYYFNPENPAAFTGPGNLFQVLDKKYPGVFTRDFIREWLNNQDAYYLQKPVRHRFRTTNVRVTTFDEQLDVDLLSMENLTKGNDGIRFLLCAIDILSRKLWVRPLPNKTVKSVLKAMQDILKEVIPKNVRADKGSDFVNKWFIKLMKDNDIYFFSTQNPPKANFVERVQRTLKTAIYI